MTLFLDLLKAYSRLFTPNSFWHVEQNQKGTFLVSERAYFPNFKGTPSLFAAKVSNVSATIEIGTNTVTLLKGLTELGPNNQYLVSNSLFFISNCLSASLYSKYGRIEDKIEKKSEKTKRRKRSSLLTIPNQVFGSIPY